MELTDVMRLEAKIDEIRDDVTALKVGFAELRGELRPYKALVCGCVLAVCTGFLGMWISRGDANAKDTTSTPIVVRDGLQAKVRDDYFGRPDISRSNTDRP